MKRWIAILMFGLMPGVISGQPVELQLKLDDPELVEWVTGESLQITWLDLLDSRCAEGVTCVWEGEVTITIGVAKNGRDLGEFEITLHAGDEEKAFASVEEYAIRLISVAPYPKDGIETKRSDYVATLEITSAPTAVEMNSWGRIKAQLVR